MSTIMKRLTTLGLTLPTYHAPNNNLVRVKQSGKLLFVSGHGPHKADGTFLYSGQCGGAVSFEQACESARFTALNILSSIHHAGRLDDITEVLKLQAFVNVAEDFTKAGLVVNAASDVFTDIWGEHGLHTRSVINMGHMGKQPIGMEMIFEVK